MKLFEMLIGLVGKYGPKCLSCCKKANSEFMRFCENIGGVILGMKRRNHRYFIRYAKSDYGKSVRSLWREFKSQIFSTAVTTAVVISICAVVNLLDWSLGYEVIVDGENIGMVTDRQTVFDAIDEVGEEVRGFFGDDTVYEKNPAFVRRIVDEKKLASKKTIKSALLSNMDTMVEGYAVYIDGTPVFGVSSEEAVEWVLAEYKKKYAGEEIAEDMSVDFCETLEVRNEFMHIALLETPESAIDVLSGNDKELATYTVRKNDTLWGIADKFDTTIEHILAMNENITENIREDMVINVEKAVPRLSVRTVQTVLLTETVPHKIEKIDDSSIYEGRTVVTQAGKDGTAKVLARVTKINGVQTDKKVLESETLTDPVTQIEKIGTKKRPATTGSGTFIKPSFGTLSSRYGRRWGRNHNGIDIAGAYNSDIKAADGGVVTFSGWMSGYGYFVTINHENGYETGYGHCASLCVNVGDRVAKGDVVAKMGNTGRSTGTHLHFEVKKNGSYINPLQYVGY